MQTLLLEYPDQSESHRSEETIAELMARELEELLAEARYPPYGNQAAAAGVSMPNQRRW